jgi:hypothetical protein
VILHFLGGIGDELLLTCVARELRKRMPNHRIWQIGFADQLLQGNPDYSLIFGKEHWPLRHSNLLKHWRMVLRYTEMPATGYEVPPSEHILAVLCRKAGIRGEIELRPFCHLLEAEAIAGRLAPLQVTIQSVGEKTHETWMNNKNWYHERFQTVVDGILKKWPDITIIQLGVASDPPLKGVWDLRGKTGLRHTAAILSQSLCFIGTSGLLVHLARSVDCHSVVIYGGREHSWQSGYTCNENLDTLLPCAPCWLWHDCDFDRECMKRIAPTQVLAAVDRALASVRKPSPADTATIKKNDAVSPPTYPTIPGWEGIAHLPPFNLQYKCD